MAKTPREEPGIGSDSFLDVITNVVGIVNILVMVMGLRIKQAPAQSDATTISADSLAAATAAVAETENDLYRLKTRLHDLENQEADALSEIDVLAKQAQQVQAAAESLEQNQLQHQKEIEQSQRSLLDLRFKLQRLQGDLQSTLSLKPALVQIESYPTPLSRAVDGPEAHFQLLGGRIVYVPFEELKTLLEADVHRKIATLKNSPELAAVVGPARGFSMSYVVKRPESAGYAYLHKVTFVPENNQMGETLDEALRQQSNFRGALAKYVPRLSAVTLWTYPDSFAEYRKLKKELYQMGFTVAGRPLPFGQLITGSPQGSKSSAQ